MIDVDPYLISDDSIPEVLERFGDSQSFLVGDGVVQLDAIFSLVILRGRSKILRDREWNRV